MSLDSVKRHIETPSPVFEGDSVIKPIGELAKVIEQTSAGDLLLLMIAQQKKDEQCQSNT